MWADILNESKQVKVFREIRGDLKNMEIDNDKKRSGKIRVIGLEEW